MAWELIEKWNGNITNQEVVEIYDLLYYSSYLPHTVLADKLLPIVEIAKYEIANGLKAWENEGGTCT